MKKYPTSLGFRWTDATQYVHVVWFSLLLNKFSELVNITITSLTRFDAAPAFHQSSVVRSTLFLSHQCAKEHLERRQQKREDQSALTVSEQASLMSLFL